MPRDGYTEARNGTTHWEGCEVEHKDCADAKLKAYGWESLSIGERVDKLDKAQDVITERLWESFNDLSRRVGEIESIGERVDLLKLRLDLITGEALPVTQRDVFNLARRVSDMESSCSMADHSEILSLCERVSNLAERVVELEGREQGEQGEAMEKWWLVSGEMARLRRLESEHAECVPMQEGWIRIEGKVFDQMQAQLARAGRIEEAARAHSDAWASGGASKTLDALREALKP